jgi:hypothetical protein
VQTIFGKNCNRRQHVFFESPRLAAFAQAQIYLLHPPLTLFTLTSGVFTLFLRCTIHVSRGPVVLLYLFRQLQTGCEVIQFWDPGVPKTGTLRDHYTRCGEARPFALRPQRMSATQAFLSRGAQPHFHLIKCRLVLSYFWTSSSALKQGFDANTFAD